MRYSIRTRVSLGYSFRELDNQFSEERQEKAQGAAGEAAVGSTRGRAPKESLCINADRKFRAASRACFKMYVRWPADFTNSLMAKPGPQTRSKSVLEAQVAPRTKLQVQTAKHSPHPVESPTSKQASCHENLSTSGREADLGRSDKVAIFGPGNAIQGV